MAVAVRRARLSVEALERRLALSTLTVINNADSGAGSLRQAVLAANSGDTIRFASSVHAITLTSGELNITKNLTITGPGSGLLTISGNDSSRVLHIETGANVKVTGLTITRGRAQHDGTPTSGGGGIRNEPGATLTLSRVTLDSNRAIGVEGFDVFGGGLFNWGTATLMNCMLSNNEAIGGGTTDTHIGGSAGGAIDNFGGATLVVSDTSFRDNRVNAAAGASYFAIAGAVECNAGLFGFDPDQAVPSSATFTNCTFVNNVAQSGSGGYSNGGAIVNEGFGTTLTLIGCRFDGNRSVATEGEGASQAVGGAVVHGAGTADIVNCIFTNNVAQGGPNADVAANGQAGSAFGGAINNNYAGTMRISGTLLIGNQALGGPSVVGSGGSAFGGAISNSGFGGNLTVTNSTILNNRAVGGASGPASGGRGGVGFGGGVDTSNGATSTLNYCLIVSNVAKGGAGAAGNRGGDGLGGGLAVGLNHLFGLDEEAHLHVNHCIVVSNKASGGAAGSGATGGDGKGGGLYIFSPVGVDPLLTSATLTSTLFVANSATGAGGGSQGIGGGIYRERAKLTLDAPILVLGNQAQTGPNLYLI